MTTVFTILKRTVQEWLKDNCPRLGAALAFYSALSIGPLLILFFELGEVFWTRDVLTGHLSQQMEQLIGKDGTDIISIIVMHSQNNENGVLATILSLVILFVGASGVFSELQDAFNTIWHVPAPKNMPLWHIIAARFVSFAMILGTGFLLLTSLLITMLLHIVTQYFILYVPGFSYVALVAGWLLSLGINVLLFAAIFRLLPDTDIRYRDVWWGALLTALLFDAGKWLISFYISHSAVHSTYGAAGSFVVFLIWVYYSAQILYFGAEFTKVSKEYGKNPRSLSSLD
ncbi:MAG TPA: YihY/virulence factor BrkB family protein [Rickettsiales bacterium]|nr:YihY/virulence factor BrkB family protein [Rickettsiales bacterium]